MTKFNTILAASMLIASSIVANAQSAPKVIAEGIPEGWHINSIGGAAKDNNMCTAARGLKLVLSDRCTDRGGGVKRCMWDCVPLEGQRRADK